jgi:single-strand DNA-binding protein
MPAVNRVQLIGYLGRAPESKYTSTGKRVTGFPIAITSRWKSDEGETKEYTEWVNIEAWDRLAEICHEYLAKGSLIYVEGRLKTNRYEDPEGEARYFTKVVAQTIQFLSDNRDDQDLIEQPEYPAEEEPELLESTES